MEPVRILQIVTQMTCAGLENRLMDIYRNIDRKCIQFDFYTFRKEPGFFDEEIKALGGKIFYFDSINLKRLVGGNIDNELFTFFMRHSEYKIVHAHLNQWCWIVLKSAKNTNIPIRIAHSRNSFRSIDIKNIAKNIIKLPTGKFTTHQFAVSQKAGIWLFGKKAVNNGDVVIWPNAIDCKKFRYNPETRRKKRIELKLNNAFTLVHVGRLTNQKNHFFLIDIFDNLFKKNPDLKLLLIGDDQMNGSCQKYALKKQSADNIFFLSARSDIPDLLQAGDVFVFPSKYEGFPGAVLEAQAAGLPCIISDTITNEVCLTDNIFRLPVNKGTDNWINKILEYKDITRKDTYNTIVEKGYDIHALCQRLSEFYKSAYISNSNN